MVTRYGLKEFPLARPITTQNVDNTINRAGSISKYALQRIVIGDKSRMERLLITDIGKTSVILGLPWLAKVNPKIDWQNKTLLINQLNQPKENSRNTAPWTFRAYLELNEECTIRKTTLATKLAQDQGQKDNRPRILEEMIPREYHQFLTVFDKRSSERFPPARTCDHAIELKNDFVPKDCKVYPLSPKEQQVLDEFLDENLQKGYIRPSKSPQASPFFFVGKKDGAL